MNTVVYFERRNKLNKMLSLALLACKEHKGKYHVHHWAREAVRYLIDAKQYLRDGYYTLYRIAVQAAKRNVERANYELHFIGAL